MPCFSVVSNPKPRKFSGKTRMTFKTILTIHQIIEGVQTKNFEVTLLFVDFSKAFDSLLAYGIPKEAVTGIMVLWNGSLTWWRLWLLQHCHWSHARRCINAIFVYTLTRLCTTNLHRSNKKNGFTLKRLEADEHMNMPVLTDQ